MMVKVEGLQKVSSPLQSYLTSTKVSKFKQIKTVLQNVPKRDEAKLERLLQVKEERKKQQEAMHT
jgi:hypothetical protein